MDPVLTLGRLHRQDNLPPQVPELRACSEPLPPQEVTIHRFWDEDTKDVSKEPHIPSATVEIKVWLQPLAVCSPGSLLDPQ